MTRPWDAARIAEARARCEAATPDWQHCTPGVGRDVGKLVVTTVPRGHDMEEYRNVGSFQRRDDAAFAAAARADLPEALDEIDRLRAKLQRCDEIRLSQVRELRKQDGLIATLRDEINRLRRGLP